LAGWCGLRYPTPKKNKTHKTKPPPPTNTPKPKTNNKNPPKPPTKPKKKNPQKKTTPKPKHPNFFFIFFFCWFFFLFFTFYDPQIVSNQTFFGQHTYFSVLIFSLFDFVSEPPLVFDSLTPVFSGTCDPTPKPSRDILTPPRWDFCFVVNTSSGVLFQSPSAISCPAPLSPDHFFLQSLGVANLVCLQTCHWLSQNKPTIAGSCYLALLPDTCPELHALLRFWPVLLRISLPPPAGFSRPPPILSVSNPTLPD